MSAVWLRLKLNIGGSWSLGYELPYLLLVKAACKVWFDNLKVRAWCAIRFVLPQQGCRWSVSCVDNRGCLRSSWPPVSQYLSLHMHAESLVSRALNGIFLVVWAFKVLIWKALFKRKLVGFEFELISPLEESVSLMFENHLLRLVFFQILLKTVLSFTGSLSLRVLKGGDGTKISLGGTYRGFLVHLRARLF